MSLSPIYGLLLVVTTAVTYFAGILIGKTEKKATKKKYLIGALFVNFGILFVFKYFNFFDANLGSVLSWFNILYTPLSLKLLLPIGISFYTFQSLGYVIDVYRGDIKAERHFGKFALFVSFFPQLLAGPIARAGKMIPQFSEKHSFSYDRLINGLIMVLWGFFKKIVIADRLAVLVNQVYGNPTNYSGWGLIIATYCFAFQIYCDFSGYSNIAIGVAKILGYELPDNFNRPYFAQSIREFWKRWHMTLNQWFRDYVYIPLGGNRVAKWRLILNTLIVFAITGLWHGAAWTFVIWGLLHGFYLVAEILLGGIFGRIKFWPKVQNFFLFKGFKIFLTFHLVLFAWIFFRANSISDAFYIVNHLFDNFGQIFVYFNDAEVFSAFVDGLGLSLPWMKAMAMFLVFMGVVHVCQGKTLRMGDFQMKLPVVLRWSFLYFIILGILFFGQFGYTEFVYFKF
jgi:D-alanyl-lipoteichoic acid acyltransferase DltB (MBOAT superfamily)